MKTLQHQPNAPYSLEVCAKFEPLPPKRSIDPRGLERRPFDFNLTIEELFAHTYPSSALTGDALHYRDKRLTPQEAFFLMEIGPKLNTFGMKPEARQKYKYSFYAQRGAYQAEPTREALDQAFEKWFKHTSITECFDIAKTAFILLFSYLDDMGEALELCFRSAPKGMRPLVISVAHDIDPEATRAFARDLYATARQEIAQDAMSDLFIMVYNNDADGLHEWLSTKSYSYSPISSMVTNALTKIDDWPLFKALVYQRAYIYSANLFITHMSRFGDVDLALPLQHILTHWSSAWGSVFRLHHKDVTKIALTVAHTPKQYPLKPNARRWLLREGANAIVGAFELWDDEELGPHAQALIQTYQRSGYDALVRTLATTHAPALLDRLTPLAVSEDAPIHDPALSYWWGRGLKHPIPEHILSIPSGALRTKGGHALSDDQTESVFRLLQDHGRSRAKPAIKALITALDEESVDRLADHMLSIWFNSGNFSKHAWCIEALAALYPCGLEHIYVKFKALLLTLNQERPWTRRLKLSTRAADAWYALLEVIYKQDAPSAFALLVNEQETPAFEIAYMKREQRSRARLAEVPKQERWARFDRAIVAAQLPDEALQRLYYDGLKWLGPTTTLTQWLERAPSLIARGLGAHVLWRIQLPQGRTLPRFARLDLDGDLLDEHDRLLHTLSKSLDESPLREYAHANISPHFTLDQTLQARWAKTLAEHEIVLYTKASAPSQGVPH